MVFEDIFSNIDVYGLSSSIKGSKYPMSVDLDSLDDEVTKRTIALGNANSGSGEDNFLKGIIVQFDLTFTNKAWIEAERYHFFDFVSSQSTMHMISKFDLDEQYIEYVDKRMIDIMKEKVLDYNIACEIIKGFKKGWKNTKNNKNIKDADKKKYLDALEKLVDDKNKKYLEILYSNPSGFKLTARMTTNYQQLKTIYFQRKNHRLPEWVKFCEYLEILPMFKELCLAKETNK